MQFNEKKWKIILNKIIINKKNKDQILKINNYRGEIKNIC